jgi:hypothetical protein
MSIPERDHGALAADPNGRAATAPVLDDRVAGDKRLVALGALICCCAAVIS